MRIIFRILLFLSISISLIIPVFGATIEKVYEEAYRDMEMRFNFYNTGGAEIKLHVPIIEDNLIPFEGLKRRGVKGYIDVATGEIIEPEAQVVKKESGYVLVDKNGKELTNNDYTDYKLNPDYGIVLLEHYGRWGAFRYNGKEICPNIYSDITLVEDRMIVTSVEELYVQPPIRAHSGMLDLDGNEIVAMEYGVGIGYGLKHLSNDLYIAHKDNHYGIIDKNGKEIVSLKYICIFEENEGMIRVVNEDEMYGFVNVAGVEVIPPKYKYAKPFFEGAAFIMNEFGGGFINKSDEIIIPINEKYAKYPNRGYEEIYYTDCYIYYTFNDGYAITVDKYRKRGIIDINGDTIFDPKYDYIGYEKEADAFIYESADTQKWGVMDKFGKMITKQEYDYILGFVDGISIVYINNRNGAIDVNGNVVIEPTYDYMSYFFDGRAVGRKGNNWYVIYLDGTTDLIPGEFPKDIYKLCPYYNGYMIYTNHPVTQLEYIMKVKLSDNKVESPKTAVEINNKKINLPQSVVLVNDAPYIPLVSIMNELNLNFKWIVEGNKIIIDNYNGKTVTITVGDGAVSIGNDKIETDTPILYNGRTMVSLNLIKSLFNADVYHDIGSKKVSISF